MTDAAVRRELRREIRKPRCPVCRELVEELVSARMIALAAFDKYRALKRRAS